MLPMWVLALPVWLVVFIFIYALATLYVAIKYREVRKFLAGAFFVSSGTCWYLWVTGVSLPIVLPYVGTVSVKRHLRSAASAPWFISFYSCFASISVSSASRCSRNEIVAIGGHDPLYELEAHRMSYTSRRD
jgi:hypothetical protein